MILKIDFHVHSDLSPDGRDGLADILSAAEKQGLDGIALCDHDMLSEPKEGRPFIIPACECSTSEGHIIGLFISALPSCLKEKSGRLPTASEAIEEIRALGGISVWAHPYERHTSIPEDAAAKADFIETCNARACFKNKKANEMARELAVRLDKPCLGGSDAHSGSEVGNAFTKVDCKDISLDSIKEALLQKIATPVIKRNTPRIKKGLSQFAKCRRGHVSFSRMIKAYIYIAYCLLLDLIKPL